MATANPVSDALRCIVVTPERSVLDEAADFVAVPMADGELGIARGRLPLIGRLGFGELRLRQGRTIQRYYVDGGFVQVRANVVTVLTARAIAGTALKVEAALQTLEATHGIAPTPEVQEAHLRDQARARAQLRIAAKSSEAESAAAVQHFIEEAHAR
jgi:F-type H+-transporting ATPase subunit epsilon